MTQGKDINLLSEVILLSRFFRRPPLWVGILSREAASLACLLILLQRDTNVEVVEFERLADNDDVSGVDIEMDKTGLIVAINSMHVGQARCDISRNFQTLERSLLGLIGERSKSRSIGILGNDRVTTEAVDIDDVRRGSEPLQRNSINTIVLFEVVFKVVFVFECLEDKCLGRTCGSSSSGIVVRQVKLPCISPETSGTEEEEVLALSFVVSILNIKLVHAVARGVVSGLPIGHGRTFLVLVRLSHLHPFRPRVIRRIHHGIVLGVIRKLRGVQLHLP
mmetsp:Transcript_32275/g.95078  ORF Transcript_32275/g.95078 Transcript_32275/m.95078 type:complete len:278 (-) Transcript_32275:1130-1963(-)